MAKIVIVGGGIVGLSTARAAIRRGHAVTLVEQGTLPHRQGASYDQHRMIRMHYGAHEGYMRMVGQAFAAWDRVWDDLGARHFADVGGLAVSLAPGDYTDVTRDAFRRGGVDHAVLDAAEIERLCPHLTVPDHAWGLLAHPGGALYADRIVDGLVAHLAASGADLRPETSVTAVDAAAGRVTLASGITVEGDLVVVAAGAWLPELLPDEFGRQPTFRQALCYVEAPERFRAGWGTAPAIVIIGDCGIYTLPSSDGTGLKFGNGPHRRAQRPSEGFGAELAEADGIIAAFSPYLREAADYRPLRMQVGYYTMDPSRRFRFTKEGRRVVVTNCDGQMFKFGPLVGEELMASFDGERSFDDLAHWAAGH